MEQGASATLTDTESQAPQVLKKNVKFHHTYQKILSKKKTIDKIYPLFH